MTNPAFAFEKRLTNRTKKEILADKLIAMILNGLLRDGDVLPSERELNKLFGVSRETVRGALSQLTAYGLISVSHGSKTRIRASDEVLARFRSAQSDELSSQVHRFDVDSVFESRIVVEAAIARRAAMNINTRAIEQLEGLLDAQSRLFESPVHFQLSDQKFHRLISEQAANGILLRYAEELYSYGLDVRRQVMMEPGAIERSYHEHCHIVQALSLGDPEAAERAMLIHLDSVYRTTKAKIHAS